jgi:aspartate ammonia-lyase
VKKAAARAHLGLLPRAWARAIEWAADRIVAGEIPDAAAVDILRAGAGTPAHMNVNEVIANLANERLGGRRGDYRPIHPNHHVNLGQSSNDVTPTAIRLMALELLPPLTREVRALARAFRRLAARERLTVKPGPHASAGRRAHHLRPRRPSRTPSARSRRAPPSCASSRWGERR